MTLLRTYMSWPCKLVPSPSRWIGVDEDGDDVLMCSVVLIRHEVDEDDDGVQMRSAFLRGKFDEDVRRNIDVGRCRCSP
jgi:hypothetical protein